MTGSVTLKHERGNFRSCFLDYELNVVGALSLSHFNHAQAYHTQNMSVKKFTIQCTTRWSTSFESKLLFKEEFFLL